MSNVKLICSFCKQTFIRPASWHKKNVARGDKNVFCSVECFKKSKAKPSSKCLHCGAITKNPKFCARSCSISYNNSKNPKRKRTNYCMSCNTLILSSRKYCSKCWEKHLLDIPNMTLKELSCSVGSHNSYRSTVGWHARKVAKEHNKLQKCQSCGYTLQIDCCHIKPISSFSKHTKISIINAPDNLIGLCKRCHWELDHNVLKI